MRTPEDPLLTRRALCRLFAAVPMVPLLAADAAPPKTVPSAAVLYDQGYRLLVRGRRFEKASEYLRAAVTAAPQNPQYILTLGCAYASRASSLAYAAAYTYSRQQKRANFGEALQNWENNREARREESPTTFSDAEYDKTRPTMPPPLVFSTKDDNLPFRLTAPQTETRLDDLCEKAQIAWKRGIELSQTPEQTAYAYYLQGWGQRVLRGYLENSSHFTVPNFPTEAKIKASFERATTLAPPYSGICFTIGRRRRSKSLPGKIGRLH